MLSIYYQDRLVGQIEEKTQGLSFTYAPQWSNKSNAFAISLTMPLREAEYPPETATPWFANLLPEDRILEQIGRLLGRSQGDVYGLLEQIGRETAGALSIGGPQPVDQADYRDLSETKLASVIEKLPERPLLAGEGEVTMSLAGAQTKLAVAIFDHKIKLPLRGAASTHILKPQGDRLYATVENELLCMRLASKIRLEIPSTSMGIANGRRYFLVERYDRKILSLGRVERMHQEDFCQALGTFPMQKYEARRGPGLAELFRVIDENVRRRARDRLALLDLIIFACCIGDTDRHGKNYSLILTHGDPRLAPCYDLMSTLPYDGITRNLAMKIAGKNRAEYLERRHWEQFARDVRLSPAATVHRVEELALAVAEQVNRVGPELIDEFPVDRDAIKLFTSKIYDQARRVSENSRRNSLATDSDHDESHKDIDSPP